jgi:hypothetical protein
MSSLEPKHILTVDGMAKMGGGEGEGERSMAGTVAAATGRDRGRGSSLKLDLKLEVELDRLDRNLWCSGPGGICDSEEPREQQASVNFSSLGVVLWLGQEEKRGRRRSRGSQSLLHAESRVVHCGFTGRGGSSVEGAGTVSGRRD